MKPLWLEISIIALQLLVAVAVARLAVVWALDRFKIEKSWERRFQAYSDILVALNEMASILYTWIAEQKTAREIPPARDQELRIQYDAANKRIDEIETTAELLLPAETIATVRMLQKTLSQVEGDYDWTTDIILSFDAVDKARREVAAQGRKVLDVDRLGQPSLFRDPRGWLKFRNDRRLSYDDQPTT